MKVYIIECYETEGGRDVFQKFYLCLDEAINRVKELEEEIGSWATLYICERDVVE